MRRVVRQVMPGHLTLNDLSPSPSSRHMSHNRESPARPYKLRQGRDDGTGADSESRTRNRGEARAAALRSANPNNCIVNTPLLRAADEAPLRTEDASHLARR